LTLGTETLEGESGSDKGEIVKNFSVDTSRTLGLHGTAILSRFPLKNVRVVRLCQSRARLVCDEKKAVSALEKGKQKGAGIVFSERIVREVRRGGRMMILAEVEEPQIPGGVLPLLRHTWNRKRNLADGLKQLEEVLKRNSSYRASVVVAGDMNTSGTDSTPTSFQREVKKRMGSSSFWANKGIKYATGAGVLYECHFWTRQSSTNVSDPTVKSVKFVSENPEENFFNDSKGVPICGRQSVRFQGREAVFDWRQRRNFVRFKRASFEGLR